MVQKKDFFAWFASLAIVVVSVLSIWVPSVSAEGVLIMCEGGAEIPRYNPQWTDDEHCTNAFKGVPRKAVSFRLAEPFSTVVCPDGREVAFFGERFSTDEEACSHYLVACSNGLHASPPHSGQTDDFACASYFGNNSITATGRHYPDYNPDATADPTDTGSLNCTVSGGLLGIPTWYQYLEMGPKDGDPCAIIGPNDANGDLDIRAAIYRVGLAVIEIMLRLAVIIAAIFVIVGGFRYITSQGEPENAKSARQTITNALIGMVISLLATGLVAFIANRLTQ